MPKLSPGDQAPPWALQDQEGHTVRLADFQGRKLLLYFYPKADTPGCTKQACSVSNSREDLASLGVDVVGISPDDTARQKKFDAKYNLGFPLLSDADHAIAEAYGVWGEKTMYGKKVQGIIRSSFLIDESGKISQVWYKVKPEETVAKAKLALNIEG